MNEVKYFLQLLLLIILQVILLNHIDFLGFANPMLYLLFFITFPYKENNSLLLLLAFVIGIIIDVFSDTGGIFAASTLGVVFVRPLLIRILFGQNFVYQDIKLLNLPSYLAWLYTFIFTFVYFTIFYLLDIFNFNHWLLSFNKIIVSTLFTTLICMFCVYSFSSKSKS